MQVVEVAFSLVVVLCVGLVERTVANGKYNILLSDMAECRTFVTNGTNNYMDFYQIEALNNRRNFTEDLLLVQLYILGAMDAHILLTAAPVNPEDKVPVYVIVLGAGSNTFSEIRRHRRVSNMAAIKRKQVLSAVEVLPVQIRITLAGSIEVTVANEDQPFMSAFDETLLSVKYMAFASWGSTAIKFFYDCNFSKNNYDYLEEEKNELVVDPFLEKTYDDYLDEMETERTDSHSTDDYLEKVETELKQLGRLHASLAKPQFLTMMVVFITIQQIFFS